MLNQKQKKSLKRMAHHCKPVVMMGAGGLSEAVLVALEEALDKHELVKIKVSAADRDERERVIQSMLEHTHTELIQRVGNMATIFRRNPQNPVIRFD